MISFNSWQIVGKIVNMMVESRLFILQGGLVASFFKLLGKKNKKYTKSSGDKDVFHAITNPISNNATKLKKNEDELKELLEMVEAEIL